MATVQAAPEMSLPKSLAAEQEQNDLTIMALTMATIRLVNPWSDSSSSESNDRIITLAEVSLHDSYNDCWVVIYDRIYDITTFFDEHPGGADIMLEYAGQDASTAFRSSGHSRMALKALGRFHIGELPMHERMYRRPGGIKLSDIPE